MKTIITHLFHLINLFDLAKGEIFKPLLIASFVNLCLVQGSGVGLDGRGQDHSATKPTDSPSQNWLQCFYTNVSVKEMFRRWSVKALPFCKVILLFLHPSPRELPQCSRFLSMSSDRRRPCCGTGMAVLDAGEGDELCLFCILPLAGTPQAAGETTQSLGFLWVIPLLISHKNLSC